MNNNISEYIGVLKQEKRYLQNNYNVAEIGIFGSYSRGEETSKSDIDILVDFSSPIGWNVVDLKEYLEYKLKIPVDLVLKGGIARNRKVWEEMKDEIIYV